MNKESHLRVKSFEPNLIQIEIIDFNEWKTNNSDDEIKIGSFLKINDSDDNSILSLVQSFRMVENEFRSNSGITNQVAIPINEYSGNFIINTQPIGRLVTENGIEIFKKGIKDISIPPTGVSLASREELTNVFSNHSDSEICFATHQIDDSIEIIMDGDKFFSKHIAVVGSTGTGKSCAVAKVIQEAKKNEIAENELSDLNNTHILIFDIHGEYSQAFPQANYLSVEGTGKNQLKLPYWLMNSEELEDLFIESAELNSHNQVSQFKHAVTENKKKYNHSEVTYDSLVYFSMKEVFNYIRNKNNETHYISKDDRVEYYAVLEDEKYDVSNTDILWDELDFEKSTGNSHHDVFKTKVFRSGGFHGEFDRFISRLETKLRDKRLSFILSENNENTKANYESSDFVDILRSLIGYDNNDNQNINIIDLSSMPFEVVSIVVSMVSRLLFDFSYYKMKAHGDNDTPFMIVYEEAHKYVPKNSESKYRNTRIAVERIAKEGRKYGISAMVVSQRPSELSSTVFSQCNNFIIMRLTNPDDQMYVKKLLPDAVISYGDELAALEQREALLVGDSLSTPCIAKIKTALPVPKSEDIKFYTKWKEQWKNIGFDKIINQINNKFN